MSPLGSIGAAGREQTRRPGRPPGAGPPRTWRAPSPTRSPCRRACPSSSTSQAATAFDIYAPNSSGTTDRTPAPIQDCMDRLVAVEPAAPLMGPGVSHSVPSDRYPRRNSYCGVIPACTDLHLTRVPGTAPERREPVMLKPERRGSRPCVGPRSRAPCPRRDACAVRIARSVSRGLEAHTSHKAAGSRPADHSAAGPRHRRLVGRAARPGPQRGDVIRGASG